MSNHRVAIVTGASRGFGRAVTLDLLRAGWVVVGDGRTASTLARLEETAASDSLRLVQGDIGDATHLRTLVETAQRLGPLALLVTNAGVLGPTPLPALASVDTDAIVDLFRVNVIAQLRLIQVALPALAPAATIITVSSDAADTAYAGWGPYGASKAALDQLAAVFAVELPGLRFYALDPGDMRTDMHQEAFPGEDISDRQLPEASSPAVLKLVDGDYESGRYSASDLLAQKV